MRMRKEQMTMGSKVPWKVAGEGGNVRRWGFGAIAEGLNLELQVIAWEQCQRGTMCGSSRNQALWAGKRCLTGLVGRAKDAKSVRRIGIEHSLPPLVPRMPCLGPCHHTVAPGPNPSLWIATCDCPTCDRARPRD